jgi:hypothetical protein
MFDCGREPALGSFSFEAVVVLAKPIPTAGSEVLTSLLMGVLHPTYALWAVLMWVLRFRLSPSNPGREQFDLGLKLRATEHQDIETINA